jgi:hypothetical protein
VKITRRAKLYAQENLEAARIILADPARHAGIAVLWARLLLERENETARVNYRRLPLLERPI